MRQPIDTLVENPSLGHVAKIRRAIVRPPESSFLSRLALILLFFAVVWGLTGAIARFWMADDAFISLRYAENLAAGNGLVFNSGEFVEGYSNFLWTVILAFAIKVGSDPVSTAQSIGTISFLITAGAFAWYAWRRSRENSALVFLPLTALAVLFNREMQVYATGGLETSFLAALVALGFVITATADSHGRYLLGGLFFTLATLTRMDALVMYLGAAGFLFVEQPQSIKRMASFLAPVFTLFLPYWLIRYLVYGYPFPNTYYAKSATLSYWSQGLEYLTLFLKTYPALVLVPLAVITLLLGFLMSKKTSRRSPARDTRPGGLPAGLLAASIALPYALAVVKVGGGFMFARLFIPICPLLYFILEDCSFSLIRKRNYQALALGTLAVLSLIRFEQFNGPHQINGIADERAYYPPEWHLSQKNLGRRLNPYFQVSGASLAFDGAGAMFTYYARPTVAIESSAGLTDDFVAHLPLTVRGRPGHEKAAPLHYLRQRGIHLKYQMEPQFTFPEDKLRKLTILNIPFQIISYDNGVMDRLKNLPGVEFTIFSEYLDNYLLNLDHISANRLTKDYRFFRDYYFRHNQDPLRERPILERLRELNGPAPRSVPNGSRTLKSP